VGHVVLEVVLLVAGLGLLVVGGDLLVRGASALARILGVPSLVIGLTVVAFGTSAPELAVNLAGSVQGTTAVSFGNVVGSNIANVGLILGLASLVRPLDVHASLISREIPMMILASAVALAMGADGVLGAGPATISRPDGVVLMLLFGVFMYYTVADVIQRSTRDTLAIEAEGYVRARRLRPIAIDVLLVAGGLAALVLGGHVAVKGAVGVARTLGVPEVVIAATIVAVGTSLPELVTSVVAGARGLADIAIGNIVGSNIFNLLLILGLSSTIRPVPVPPGGLGDLLFMVGFSVVLMPFAFTGRRLVRLEGAALLAAYVGYVLWRVV
jgi:cation:H+ antiporter